MDLDGNFVAKVEQLFDELILHQQKKVLQTARHMIPHLTSDDILNPHDFPELMQNPIFNYEEGMEAGLRTAYAAVRARLLRTSS